MMAQIEGDEITVTTKEGEADVIEVPEGMLLEIDSLLNQYNPPWYHCNGYSRKHCHHG